MANPQSGRQIAFIPVPGKPANLCIAGPDHRTLYLTARTGFYSIRTRIRDANLVK